MNNKGFVTEIWILKKIKIKMLEITDVAELTEFRSHWVTSRWQCPLAYKGHFHHQPMGSLRIYCCSKSWYKVSDSASLGAAVGPAGDPPPHSPTSLWSWAWLQACWVPRPGHKHPAHGKGRREQRWHLVWGIQKPPVGVMRHN